MSHVEAPVETVESFGLSHYLTLTSGPSAWLLEPIIPFSGSAMLFGPSKGGKSTAAIQLSFALAKGEPWLAHSVSHPHKVLYMQIDNPRTLWRQRFAALSEAGVTLPPDTHFQVIDKESAPYPFNILNPAHAAAVKARIAAYRPDLLVVDTLRESYRGDENDSDRLQQVLSTFTAISRPAAILYVHHGRKPSTDPFAETAIEDGGRGSSYIPGAVDTIMNLSSRKDKQKQVIRGTLSFKGRCVSETDYKLVMDPHTFLWAPEGGDGYAAAVIATLEDATFETDAARAASLALRFPHRALNTIKKDIVQAKNRADSQDI